MNRRTLNNAKLRAQALARAVLVRHEMNFSRRLYGIQTSGQENQSVRTSGVQTPERDALPLDGSGRDAGTVRGEPAEEPV